MQPTFRLSSLSGLALYILCFVHGLFAALVCLRWPGLNDNPPSASAIAILSDVTTDKLASQT